MKGGIIAKATKNCFSFYCKAYEKQRDGAAAATGVSSVTLSSNYNENSILLIGAPASGTGSPNEADLQHRPSSVRHNAQSPGEGTPTPSLQRARHPPPLNPSICQKGARSPPVQMPNCAALGYVVMLQLPDPAPGWSLMCICVFFLFLLSALPRHGLFLDKYRFSTV